MVFKKTARYTFVLLTAIQLILAIMWVAANITVVPDLGVCRDYLEAADRQVCDEFMSYFYMQFVRFILMHTSTLVTFAPILYIFQLVIMVTCALYFARTITGDIIMHVTITVFIVTNPLVLSTVMQVSPASLHFAIFIWLLSVGVDSALLREKQIYGNVLGRIAKWAAFGVLSIVLIFANSKLAVSGSMGRAERNLENYALQRFVWPHFNEITYTFYLEQTGYDSSAALPNYLSSEYLWTGFIPSLYEQYGEAGSQMVERYVEEFGFTIRTKENIIEWGKDILSYFFAPYTVIFNMGGNGYSHTGQLYEQFTLHGIASRIYWRFSCMFTLFWTIYSVIGITALYIIKKVKRFVGMKLFINRFSINAMSFALLLSLIASFFTMRGFDYRNVLWTVIMWPIILLFPFLSDEFR